MVNERLKKRIEEEEIFHSYQERLLSSDNEDVWKKLPEDEDDFIKLARKSAGLE